MIIPKTKPNPTQESPLIPLGTRAERRDAILRKTLNVKKALGFDYARVPIIRRETEVEWYQIQYQAESSAYETLELLKPEFEKLASHYAPNCITASEIFHTPNPGFPNDIAVCNENASSVPIQQLENPPRFRYNVIIVSFVSSLLCLAVTVTSFFLIIALRRENTAMECAIQNIHLKLENPTAYELHLKNGTAPVTPVRQER